MYSTELQPKTYDISRCQSVVMTKDVIKINNLLITMAYRYMYFASIITNIIFLVSVLAMLSLLIFVGFAVARKFKNRGGNSGGTAEDMRQESADYVLMNPLSDSVL